MVVDSTPLIIDSFPLNEQFLKNDLTRKWLIEILAKNDPIFKKKSNGTHIRNILIKEIGEKKGIMSYVFRVLLEFDNENQYSFVMKKPTLEPINGLAFENVEMNKTFYTNEIEELKYAHNQECEAFGLIKDVKNVPIPKIYYIEKCSDKSSGFIAMEDFCGKANIIGIFRSPTQEHCLNIARHIGHFQAQMNKIQHKWKGKHLKIVCVEHFNEKMFSNALKNIGGTRPEFKTRLQFLLNFDVFEFHKYSLHDLAKEIDAITLCHGDLSSKNVMVKLAEDGSLLNEFAAIIDWQTIFEGSPYADLARFLVHCSDTDVRRSWEKECVNLQYDTFCEVSKNLGLKVKYTREDAHKLYEYAAIQQSIKLFERCNTLKSKNLENADEEVLDAQYEKLLLRCRLALDDSFKYVQKYEIVERFALKNKV